MDTRPTTLPQRQRKLIAKLQQLQARYGFLPRQELIRLQEEHGIPLNRTYGVATFYSGFSLRPRGETVITICRGTACHVNGSLKVLKAVEKYLGISAGESTGDMAFCLDTATCLGLCFLSPVMTIDDRCFGHIDPERAVQIIRSYREA